MIPPMDSLLDFSGTRVKLSCVNWYGFQLEDLVLNGLDRQPLEVIALRIKELGFNCVRLVYALDVIYKNPVSQNLCLLKRKILNNLSLICPFFKSGSMQLARKIGSLKDGPLIQTCSYLENLKCKT